MTLRGGTLFSGIGAPEYAAPWIDWRWCAEIDPFASAVHATRFPNVPNLGDVTKVDWSQYAGSIDVLVAGSPCQSFSISGRRLGLDDPRGNLALVTIRIARDIGVRWLVYENVPGLLSSDRGRDFGAFLGTLAECGFRWVYRVLDAQYFGVAQRRRRLFLVACLDPRTNPIPVLFEPDSLRGHPAPSREAGQKTAGALASRATAGGGLGTDFDIDGGLVAQGESDVARALNAGANKRFDAQGETFITHTLRGDGFDASEDGTGRGTPLVPAIAPALTSGAPIEGVRRLMPVECERLQGFPDDWTRIPVRSYKAKPQSKHAMKYPDYYERIDGVWTRMAADGPRYKAIGNSMAVPVMRWILDRLTRVDAIAREAGI